MDLYNLNSYDLVIMWGYGNDALWYKGQFRVDYIVDKDDAKIGIQLDGIEVKAVSQLIQDKENKKILIIISSSKYSRDIKEEIHDLQINADLTELSIMKAIYGRENTSFALWGFDILIRDILVRGGYNLENMSYLEIGACHPILGSNTYNMYIAGCRGILVEPNPDLKEVLKCYRDDICLMQGVSSSEGTLKFYRFDNEFRNTFDQNEADKAIKKGFVLKDTVELPVVKLDSIICNNNINPQNTFLSIQVMGLENDILKGFDYKKYQFPVIAIAYYSEDIFAQPMFDNYYVIAKVPRHVVLVNRQIYERILG